MAVFFFRTNVNTAVAFCLRLRHTVSSSLVASNVIAKIMFSNSFPAHPLSYRRSVIPVFPFISMAIAQLAQDLQWRIVFLFWGRGVQLELNAHL